MRNFDHPTGTVTFTGNFFAFVPGAPALETLIARIKNHSSIEGVVVTRTGLKIIVNTAETTLDHVQTFASNMLRPIIQRGEGFTVETSRA